MTDHTPQLNADSGEGDAAALDSLLMSLGDRHRRRIVLELAESDSRTVAELGRAHDHDARTSESSLYHVHLPKLRDAGIVDWDPDAALVRRGPRFEDAESVVDFLRTDLSSGMGEP